MPTPGRATTPPQGERGPTSGPGLAPLLLTLTLVMLMAFAGCTYAKEEPSLFPRPRATEPLPPVPSGSSRPPPQPTNPALPVAGEALWTSGADPKVQARIAVHAVRRIDGATVLDWSVTPLSKPGASPGDSVSVDLGLTRPRGGINAQLIDPAAERVYRPLSHRSVREFNHCLCTPLWAAQLTLRLGETRMLQVTYPELPASLRFVDVNLVTLAPFTHLPVTPLGEAPTARRSTDLSRAPEPVTPLMRPLTFLSRADQRERRQSIAATRIIAGPDRTSVEWSLTSLTDHPVFALVPVESPIAGSPPRGWTAADVSSVSGPQLRPSGVRSPPTLTADWVSDTLAPDRRAECLCTGLSLWASSLRRAGGRASMATNYPALPAGTTRVDLVLPGVGVVKGLPLSRPVDAARLTGPPEAARSSTWTYSIRNPPRGWTTQEWPTPVPENSQLRDYVVTVDRPVPGRQ